MTHDTCGRTSAKPFAYYDHESRSLKTSQGTEAEVSRPYSATVPKTGSMFSGFLYEHPTPEPRTDENDSSLRLPTPMARDCKGISFSPDDMSRLVNVSVKLFPTPSGSDAAGSRSPKEGRDTKVQVGLPNVVKLFPTPRTTDANGPGKHGTGGSRPPHNDRVPWGEYEPTIRRWESILSRPAPDPSEPNKNGRPRLRADFDEWMMGLPEGWVTDIDIPYGAKIKLLGNGVVPQQAELAIRYLFDLTLHEES